MGKDNKSITGSSSVTDISNEEQFNRIADIAPVMLWASDADKNFYYFNKRRLDFTDHGSEQEKALDRLENIHADDLHKYQHAFNSFFDKREPFKLEYRLKRNDGEYRWVLDSATPRFDEEGNFAGYVGACTDITDIKELEQRKNDFIGTVSHEIKTPLTTMKVYIQILEDILKTKGDEQLQELVANISKQANKFSSLIKDLLDMARTEENIKDYKKAELSYAEVVRDAVSDFKKNHSEAQIELAVNSSPKITGDKEKLSRVIKNILENALKYSDGNKKIKVAVTEENNMIKTTVTNEGPGIPKEYQSKIFERFFRTPDKRNKTYPGLGLGLYTASEIIKNHSGNITVNSVEGKETTFSFTLPYNTKNE